MLRCQIKVQSKQENKIKKNRKGIIIWFNPPYGKNDVTKVGHYFFKLLDKHFPQEQMLHKIINKSTVKVRYSCTKDKITNQQPQ